MEDGSRLGWKDASMLIANIDSGFEMLLLFTHLVTTIFKTLLSFPIDILSVIMSY